MMKGFGFRMKGFGFRMKGSGLRAYVVERTVGFLTLPLHCSSPKLHTNKM